MVGQHHQFNGHEPGQTLGDSEEQVSLACYSSWGCRVRHSLVTEQEQQMCDGVSLCFSFVFKNIFIGV